MKGGGNRRILRGEEDYEISYMYTCKDSIMNPKTLFEKVEEGESLVQGTVYTCTQQNLPVLMALVQSVIRRLPNSLCPMGRIHGRTHGCKWSLLKVREGKYKREHEGPRWN
jgi:hypothetical protein